MNPSFPSSRLPVRLFLAVALSGCSPARAPGGACEDGRLLAGGCVSEKTAAAYCGKAALYERGGCMPKTCPAGHRRDEATGLCLSPAMMRPLAHDLELDQEHTLGCEDDRVLVVAEGHARCVAPEASCGRGARWTGEACTPPGDDCPPGRVREGSVCAPFVGGGGVVDVGLWARLTVGADGGRGSPDVCGEIVRRPWLYTGATGPTPTVVRARITLVFPDNDVTRARAEVSVMSLSDGGRHEAPFPGRATELVEEGVGPLLEALRSVGGTASAASLTTTVACPLLQTDDPVALPRPIT